MRWDPFKITPGPSNLYSHPEVDFIQEISHGSFQDPLPSTLGWLYLDLLDDPQQAARNLDEVPVVLGPQGEGRLVGVAMTAGDAHCPGDAPSEPFQECGLSVSRLLEATRDL